MKQYYLDKNGDRVYLSKKIAKRFPNMKYKKYDFWDLMTDLAGWEGRYDDKDRKISK